MKAAREYTAAFPFGGSGFGARGICSARVRLLGTEARFRSLGGIDFDPAACADFEYLTGSQALAADIATLTPEDLRRFYGDRAPDLVFLSPPCKGSSGLLSEEKSQTAKYQEMNRLAVIWTRLMLAIWAEPPRLVLLENVPRMKTRAAGMLRDVRGALRAAGYVLRDGFHDCGELGGLAQHRRRYLLVARHQRRVAPLLYQPVKKRVRGCGEVLGPLPMPEDPAGGPMHRLPRISWLNWVRLALIPAGGDWRDLEGVLAEGEARREKFKRHAVEDWDAPVGTVGGPGTNGVENVADPRIALTDNPSRHWNKYAVGKWDEPAGTVIGAGRPGSGAPSVADPRVVPTSGFAHSYRVTDWKDPAGTVTTSPSPSSGAIAVGDPRGPDWFKGILGVIPWNRPAGTITGESRPSNGTFSVADPRVKNAFDHGYAVMPWDKPSPTVAGKSHPGNGAFSVADPRLRCKPRADAYGVIPWAEAAKTVTGAACIDNGAWAVADPRLPDQPLMVIENIRKPPPGIPIIVAADGTWHRPLTTLELAVLQGLPPIVDGAPLKLHGDASSAWRERIGNGVPPPAAEAIGERMLIALLQSDLEAFALAPPDSPVWVEPERYAGEPS